MCTSLPCQKKKKEVTRELATPGKQVVRSTIAPPPLHAWAQSFAICCLSKTQIVYEWFHFHSQLITGIPLVHDSHLSHLHCIVSRDHDTQNFRNIVRKERTNRVYMIALPPMSVLSRCVPSLLFAKRSSIITTVIYCIYTVWYRMRPRAAAIWNWSTERIACKFFHCFPWRCLARCIRSYLVGKLSLMWQSSIALQMYFSGPRKLRLSQAFVLKVHHMTAFTCRSCHCFYNIE